MSLWHTAPKTKLAHVPVNRSPALSVAVFCFSSSFLQNLFKNRVFRKVCWGSCTRTWCTVCVSQRWRGTFIPAEWSITHLHPDTEFKSRTSEFQYGNTSQLSFSMSEIYRHLRESKRERPLSQGSHKAAMVDSHWSPLPLLCYTPILQNHSIWGMGRKKTFVLIPKELLRCC